jgi:integrase
VSRRLYRGKIGPTKSDYARRDVALTTAMAQRLWRARGPAESSAFIFSNEDGEPLDRSHVFRVVKAAGKRAGVPWAGLHTLRHTAATLAFRHGANAKQVQQFLGHHSASFTLDTYVHLLPDDLHVPDYMDAIIGLTTVENEAPESAVLETAPLDRATARQPLLPESPRDAVPATVLV